MNEMKKTLIYTGVALGLLLIAYFVTPERITPEAFQDQGEQFFPEFTDPNTAMTLEVIEFDKNTGAPKPFKVTFENDRWLIPSEYNYPADARDRLAQTAAGIIELKKDDVRSDNTSNYVLTGVIDPLDETAGLEGRGTRVTIKGENEVILADIIIGNPVEGKSDYRFVRLPEQKRVYAAKVNLDLSTKFQDWIETDLLLAVKDSINFLLIQDYSINERTGKLNNKDFIALNKKNNEWKADKMPSGKVVSKAAIDSMLFALTELRIVGVRPKPPGVSASLQKLSQGKTEIKQSDMRSLQSRGFYFTGEGQLVSNEGELTVRTTEGVQYKLRFGEVVSGEQIEGQAPQENRYLFITAEFADKLYPEPEKPTNMDFQNKADYQLTDQDQVNKGRDKKHSEWEQAVAVGKQKAEMLNNRFADWYYIISSESFDALKYDRSDLIVSPSQS
ncbi:MAG: DUF4340 domain-containing protein [Calditrichaeota bacterium]|nr:MAG: DUF4340 domain-containing protein [Calditrichota bacterium]